MYGLQSPMQKYEREMRAVSDAEARARMQAWREENAVNDVLDTPQPHFFMFKEAYPHGNFGFLPTGEVVSIDSVGQCKKAFEAVTSKNISLDELTKHIIFLNEYCYAYVDTKALAHAGSGKCFKVMDLKGLGFYDIIGQIRTFTTEVCSQPALCPFATTATVTCSRALCLGFTAGCLPWVQHQCSLQLVHRQYGGHLQVLRFVHIQTGRLCSAMCEGALQCVKEASALQFFFVKLNSAR
jgi:hypothetical protein